MAIDGTSEGFGVPILVVVHEGLHAGEMSTCFDSCKPHVTELERIEHICLLKLESGNFVPQLDGSFVEVVISFDVGTSVSAAPAHFQL